MTDNSHYAPDWIKIAQKDWQRMRVMLEEGDADAAGFFLQQSLEKYLKAFLLQKGWKLKKIHELDALLDEAVKYHPVLKSFYPLCERVSGYYFTERYPSLSSAELTVEEIRQDIETAEQLIQVLSAETK